MDPGVQAPEETLKLASGSCRDTAWLLVHILRHLGLAARFVSGYLIQLVPDLKALDGPAGSTADFTDLHAWTEVYIPGAGWVGLDPTSGLLTGEGHLPLAATPHYRAAAPISGGVEAADVEFSFAMKIDRVDEKPRVTFPFSDEAWHALDALGDRIEADLNAQDVRLTMGGEPTFVSIDDYQTAEWNTAAVGPTKRILADQLIRRLRDRFAPGGLIHHGQGKWYPGEPLPRWAFSLFWRTDGKPLWQDEALIATEKPLKAASVNDAHWFTESLAGRLGIATNHVLPAFEDPAERMLKEGALSANIDPADPKIDDPIERARIMREFERHLSVPAGYVLPVQRWTAQAGGGWISEVWQLRQAAAVPIARRLAGWLPAAAQFAAVCCAGRRAASGARRSVRGARGLARSPTARAGLRDQWRQLRAAAGSFRTRRCADSAAGNGTDSGAHRVRDRAARRQALCLHAADRTA